MKQKVQNYNNLNYNEVKFEQYFKYKPNADHVWVMKEIDTPHSKIIKINNPNNIVHGICVSSIKTLDYNNTDVEVIILSSFKQDAIQTSKLMGFFLKKNEYVKLRNIDFFQLKNQNFL